MSKHTPLPWHRGGTFNPDSEPHVSIWGPTPQRMASGDVIARNISPPNAELIVWAVNNCERLFEALGSAHIVIKALHGDVAWGDYQHSPEMTQINTALAKAKQSK